MVRGGANLLMAVLVAAAFGAGCGGEDAEIDLRSTPTPAVRTATPAGSTPVRTATPVVTATPAATGTVAGGATATPTGAGTKTAGGPTASPTPGSGVNASVQTTVGDLLPFFTVAGLTTGVGSAGSTQQEALAPGHGIGIATEAAVNVDNCPDGGTRTQNDQLTNVTVTLAACKFIDPDLGSFQFDGTINAALLAGTASFNVTTLDVTNSRTVTFVGSVTGAPASGGGFVVNGGPIVLTTPQGKFSLTLDHLTVDGNGNVVSGGGTLTDDDDVFDLASIKVTIRTGGLLADLLATFDDTSTKSFVIDLKKGDITPAS